MTDSKQVIVNGNVITLYRVRGFVYQSWASSVAQVDEIEERRAREWTAIRRSGSADVRRVLGEMEVD